MKPDLYLVNTCTIALSIMLFTVIFETSLAIEKNPIIVQYQHFSPEKRIETVGIENEALTDWSFKIKNELKGNIVKYDQLKDSKRVSVKLSSLKSELSLPVIVYLPDNPDLHLSDHEAGHVQIIKSLYADADAIIREIFLELKSDEFFGQGKTRTDAYENALAQANRLITAKYERALVNRANQISIIYDNLSRDSNNKASKTVEEAFRSYQRRSERKIKG